MASERDRRAVRLALRRLYDHYPEAFSSVMDDVVRNGKNWLKMLPPRRAKGSAETLMLRYSPITATRAYQSRRSASCEDRGPRLAVSGSSATSNTSVLTPARASG